MRPRHPAMRSAAIVAGLAISVCACAASQGQRPSAAAAPSPAAQGSARANGWQRGWSLGLAEACGADSGTIAALKSQAEAAAGAAAGAAETYRDELRRAYALVTHDPPLNRDFCLIARIDVSLPPQVDSPSAVPVVSASVDPAAAATEAMLDLARRVGTALGAADRCDLPAGRRAWVRDQALRRLARSGALARSALQRRLTRGFSEAAADNPTSASEYCAAAAAQLEALELALRDTPTGAWKLRQGGDRPAPSPAPPGGNATARSVRSQERQWEM